jgi:hypothetical protein
MQRVQKCDKCLKNFTQQWVAPKKQWSKLNEVTYWTGKKWKGYQFFCRSCLNEWYEKDRVNFSKLVEPNKQKLFISYRSYGVLGKNDRA